MKYSVSSKYYLTIKDTVKSILFEKKGIQVNQRMSSSIICNKIYFNVPIKTESYGTYKPAKRNISLINSTT